MARNPSDDADEVWRAGARLYSGRADPSWRLAAAQARALLAVWAVLPPSDQRHRERSVLGYRGCWLRAPTGTRWIAYDGLVVEEAGSSTTARRDAGREFERALIGTAPAGLLPSDLVAGS